MKRTISILLALCCLASIFALFGCKDSSSGQSLLYPIEGNLRTLDPQSASSTDELIVIENAMEGLVRSLDGKIVPGCAEEWDVSADGLRYTFKLRAKNKWDLNKYITAMMGEKFDPDITAHDFVFALQRACMPETKAPFFTSLAAIQNAQSVHAGQADASALGVKAINDLTLEITLERRDDNFLSTLASAVAMPCNEEFFNKTNGRYGLEKDLTLFNGPFYLSRWYEDSMILGFSEVYKGKNVAKTQRLTLKVASNKESILQNLASGTYDSALLDGRDKSYFKEAKGMTFTQIEDTALCAVFNCTDEIFENQNIRKAFCQSFTKLDKTPNEYSALASSLVPSYCTVRGEKYTAAKAAPEQDTAAENWVLGLKELDVSEVAITFICSEEYEATAKALLQGVQKTIGQKTLYTNKHGSQVALTLSLKLQALPSDEFQTAIKLGTYQAALYPFKAENNNAASFLDKLGGNGNVMRLDDVVQNSLLGGTLEDCNAAEKALLESYSVHPVLFESSYFACAAGVSGVYFNDGRVSFVNAQFGT